MNKIENLESPVKIKKGRRKGWSERGEKGGRPNRIFRINKVNTNVYTFN